MRIAYLFHWNEGHRSGVFKKIVGHCETWRELGCEVGVFVLSCADTEAEWAEALGPMLRRVARYGDWRSRWTGLSRLAEAVRAWRPDVAYHRYDLYYPQLAAVARAVPLVVELNTDDVPEYDLGPRGRAWYNRLTRGRLLARAAGFVAMSRQLAESPRFARFGKPTLVLPNGVAMKRLAPLPANDSAEVRLVFIGTPGQPWHGVDKLASLAGARPAWRFDLIGGGAEQESVARLPNVRCHGRLAQTEYEPLFARADVAVGSLALHRIGVAEIAPLKVREYLAYGLPTIVGYRDPDFPTPVPYLLELPNEPENVSSNLAAIDAFVASWKGRRVPREAVRFLDAAEREQARVRFFADTVARRRA